MGKKSNKPAFTRGRAVTQLQKELIIQTFALCGNKSEVARQLGCAVATVANVVKQAEKDRSLQEARASCLNEVAGQVHGKTKEIIDSIGAEDLEYGLIKTYDKDDPTRLTSVRAYGPSLLQKVTSAAILTDKMKVIEETKAALLQDGTDSPDQLMMPSTVQDALKMLGKKIKRIRMLDVQFAGKNEDTVSKVQDVAQRAELDKDIDEADYEELDFDNPIASGPE